MQQFGVPSRTSGGQFYSASTSSGFRLRFPSMLCMKTFLEGVFVVAPCINNITLCYPTNAVNYVNCKLLKHVKNVSINIKKNPFFLIFCWPCILV